MGMQRRRPPREPNQPWVISNNIESATSLEKCPDGNQAQGNLPTLSSSVIPKKKKEKDKGQKWSRQDYKEVMYAF